jgi:hypothetical protein
MTDRIAEIAEYARSVQMKQKRRHSMNEIERAVEHYRYGITHDIFSEPVTTYAKLAVEALRKQAERENGCEHCRGWDSRCGANYCPMCGKRLEVERDG